MKRVSKRSRKLMLKVMALITITAMSARIFTYTAFGQGMYEKEASQLNEEKNQICTDLYEQSQENTDTNKNGGAVDSGYTAPEVEVENMTLRPAELSAVGRTRTVRAMSSTTLPSSYSSVDKGYVTSVKSQGKLGICWSYAICSAMETYALKYGYAENKDDIDLSEYALAYITFDDRSFEDPLGGTDGDVTQSDSVAASFNTGGNDNMAFKSLSKWAAAVNQDKAPDAADMEQSQPDTENGKYSYKDGDMSYMLTGQKYIKMTQSSLVKSSIISNGSVTAIYSAQKHNFQDKYVYSAVKGDSLHEIAIVGWDDNIPASKFTEEGKGTPEGNGAWLVKNSWGTGAGENGYFWLSYYDKYIKDGNAVAYEVKPAGYYQHNYQWDGSTFFSYTTENYDYYNNGNKFANVFKIKGDKLQELKAVSFAVSRASAEYTVSIYKVSPAADGSILPENGNLLTSFSGKTSYSGYYTADLPESVILNPGDTFSVVIEFNKAAGLQYSAERYQESTFTMVNETGINQSYFWDTNGWHDVNKSEDGFADVSFCIKAFTNDKTEDIQEKAAVTLKQSGLNKVDVSWNNVDGASKYELYRSDSEDGTYTKIYEGNGTAYTDNVVCKKTYYYYVREYISGNSGYFVDSEKNSIVTCVPETRISDISTLENGIKITFDRISGITSYKIYRKEGNVGAEYSLIGSAGAGETSYTDKDNTLDCGMDYVYAVQTIYSKDGTDYESDLSQGEKIQTGIISGIKAEINEENKVVLTWNKVNLAKSYRLYRKVNNAKTYIGDVGNSNSFTDDLNVLSLAENSKITYEIQACGSSSTGQACLSNDVYSKYKAISGVTYTVNENGKIVFKWNGVANLSSMYTNLKYTVYISESKTGPFQTYETSSASYVSGYQQGNEKTFYVKVVAKANVVNTAETKVITKICNCVPVKVASKPEVPANITSQKYTVDQGTHIIKGLFPGTNAGTLLSSINEGSYCKIRKNGKDISSGSLVGTGMQVCIMKNGSLVRSYDIVVTGDTSGDGKINVTDMIAIKSDILKKSGLSGVYKAAGDINGDGKVNITDFIKVKAKILGKE